MRWKVVPLLQNMSFKRKLLISYLLLVIIPISVLGLFAYDQSRRFLHKNAMQSIDNTTRTMASNLEDKVERYRRLMDSIVFNVGVQKLFNSDYSNPDSAFYDLKDYFESTMSTVVKLNEEIVELTVYTHDAMPEYGNYIRNRSRVEHMGWHGQTLDQFETAWSYEQNQLIVSRKLLFQVKEPSIVAILLNEHLFFKSLWSAGTEEYGVVIADRQGKVIYYRSLLGQQLLQWHERAVGEAADGRREHGDFIAVTEPIPSPDWTAHFYIPKRLLSVEGTNIIEATVVLIVVCFFVSLLLIWIFSNTMIRPIQKLNRKMEQVENGDLSVVVQAHAGDEIGLLTKRFGDMLSKINGLIQENYENKIAQQEVELKALQAQINPHFLYNTLSMLRWKSIQAEEQELADIVTALAKFYRTALNKGNQLIAVRDEIANVKAYIDIMRIMRSNSFDVVFEWDEEIFRYETINLILQPLVENAIIHGIGKKKRDRGRLKLTGAVVGETIAFTVQDNGVGMHPEQARALLSNASKGYGLKNVNDRLRLFFGGSAGIRIDSKRHVGTSMRVSFPKKKKPPEHEASGFL